MRLKPKKPGKAKRKINSLLAALLAALLLVGCGATAQMDAAQAAVTAAAPAGIQTNQTADSSALLALMLSGIAATPETAAQVTPETALGVGGFTDAQRTALDTFCAAQPGAFSVYVQDLTSGSIYTYGTQTAYYPASLLKAAYSLWLCTLDDAGQISLDTSIPNLFGMGLADTNLQQYDGAEMLPARAALREMICVSDNDSATMLANVWPGTAAAGFTGFLAEMGFTGPESCQISPYEGITGSMTVMDAAASMTALYNYFASDAKNAGYLQECYLQTDHEMLYVPSYLLAAKKYGSWDYAYHDAAIVYAPYPYIICCMTDQGDAEVDFPEEPTAAMQALGKLVFRDLNG